MGSRGQASSKARGSRGGNLRKPLPFRAAAAVQSTVVSERWADVSVCSNALNRAARSAVTCVSILQAFEKTSVFQKRGGRRPGKTTGGREGAMDRGVWPCWCVGVCGQTRCRTLTC